MIKKKIRVLLLLLFLPMCVSAHSTSYYFSVSTLNKVGYGVVGFGAMGLLAASLFGFKEDCHVLTRAYFSGNQPEYVEVRSGHDINFISRVDVHQKRQDVALRSVLIMCTAAICYHCAMSILK